MHVPGPVRDQRGASLVELLIAMTILGIAVIAIVSGLATAVVVSDTNRRQTEAAVAARSYAEAVNGTYVPCATTTTSTYVSPAGFALPAGYTKSVTQVRYWNSATNTFTSICGADSGLQKVRLRVASDDGRASSAIDVILRKPCRNAGCA